MKKVAAKKPTPAIMKKTIESQLRMIKALQEALGGADSALRAKNFESLSHKNNHELSEKNVRTLVARLAQEQERAENLSSQTVDLLNQKGQLLTKLSEIERNRIGRRLKRFFGLKR